jgi:hypothetical protein
MNTLQLSSPKDHLEAEELEYWELQDFDDVQQIIEASQIENEPLWNINFH